MALDHIPIDKLTEDDLRALIPDATEDKRLDFKRDPIGTTDKAKKEFLADIASFATAAGGHMVLGMAEKQGRATELIGVTGIDPDQEKLRLENMIRENIDPRIQGLAVVAVPLAYGSHAIVLRIPRSWYGAHMVTFRGSQRFFSRNSAGKYPLDVHELRTLFTASETLTYRIRTFRTERVDSIIHSDTPITFQTDPKIALHLMPFASFDSGYLVDLEWANQRNEDMAPIYAARWNSRYNFDGLLTYIPGWREPASRGYVQLFRDGRLEAVDAGLLEPETVGDGKTEYFIPSLELEKQVLQALGRYLKLLGRLSVDSPVVVTLSLLNVHGYHMLLPSGHYGTQLRAVDRPQLLIQEVVFEHLNDDPARKMKPAFDAVWNATGHPGSIYYDEKGDWIGEKAMRR